MFDKIIGNNDVKTFFKNVIESGKIANSYMFIGKSGIGKKIFAREFAQNIMNTKKSVLVNPDYEEVEPDGSLIKIAQIRNIQESIAQKPTESDRKVFIIDNAELMTEESQNCLLKTLEEPPKYALIILIVENDSKLLETIKSRCVIVKFNKLTNDEIKNYIVKNNMNENIINCDTIQILDGSLEKIDTLIQNGETYDKLQALVDIIINGRLVDVLNNSDILYSSKDNIMELLNYLNIIFFKNKIFDAVNMVEITKRKLLANNNFDMCIDNLLINVWENIH